MDSFIFMFVIIIVVLELLFFLSFYDKKRSKLSKRKHQFKMLESKVCAKMDAMKAEVEVLEKNAETARAKLSGAKNNSLG